MKSKVAIALAIIVFVFIYFYFDLGHYLTFDYLKSQQSTLQGYYQSNKWQTIIIFFTVYVLVTALSLPGAAIMTLAAGGIFELFLGTVLVSFASTIGATLAFLVARFFLREYVQEKFGAKIKTINEGVEKEGAFYLFTLRLIPAFPFFVINLVMGLTPIKTSAFYFTSQVGMLLGTIVYVNAGTQLSRLESVSGILSPQMILSFALLGVFPILAKKIIQLLKKRSH